MRRAIAMRRLHEERGSYSILFAILIVTMFIMVALVVDISSVRAQVRQNSSNADFAALAGATHLPGKPRDACTAAWDYLKSNIPGLPNGANPPGGNCNWLPVSCIASTAVAERTIVHNQYTITFRYPIPAADPWMEGRYLSSWDGNNQCDRFGVMVQTDQRTFFGGIIGASGLNAPARAVSRGSLGNSGETAFSLLVLDPFGCRALEASGQAEIWIFSNSTDNPGYITLDSDGTKPNNPNVCQNAGDVTLDATGVTNSKIYACGNQFNPLLPEQCDPGGLITLYAMPGAALTCNAVQWHDCDGIDIPLRVKPQPIRSNKRRTRTVADNYWNCNTSGYPNYAPYGGTGIQLKECKGSTPRYIDQLTAFVGKTGASKPDPAFQETTNCSPAAGTVFTGNNWFVNCTNFTVNAGTVRFTGSNIVFRGNASAGSQGRLLINCPVFVADKCSPGTTSLPANCRRPNDFCLLDASGRHGYVFLRNGGTLSKGAQASIEIHHSAVFIAGSGGSIDTGAGDKPVIWTAPDHDNFPNPGDAEGPLERLALWSEGTGVHRLGGQAGLDIAGVFFTPFANPFNYAGQANQFLDRAQFITFRMNADGLGRLRMQPLPEEVLTDRTDGTSLIR